MSTVRNHQNLDIYNNDFYRGAKQHTYNLNKVIKRKYVAATCKTSIRKIRTENLHTAYRLKCVPG